MSITLNQYNSSEFENPKHFIQVSDMSEYLRYINVLSKQFRVREDSLDTKEFQFHKNLMKIWIPSTCKTIIAPTAKESPFYGVSRFLQIFTDIKSPDEIPTGWDPYWNYFNDEEELYVNYNSSLSRYQSYIV